MGGLNLVSGDGSSAFGSSVESTLGTADAPVLELRDRIETALRYTFSWSKAVGSVGVLDFVPGMSAKPLNIVTGATNPLDAATFQSRISAMQDALKSLYALLTPDLVFPGNDAAAAYERASTTFAQLYRDLQLSKETLARPDQLDELSGIADGFFDAPAAAITAVAEKASNGIAKALNGTAAAIWSALWPWLLVAGAVGVVYVFRRPLTRALGKVSS